MIKDTNINLKITLSKKQYEWLENLAQQLHISKSKVISWLISRKVEDLANYINRVKGETTDDEWDKNLEEIIRIAKTPWIQK